MHVRVKERCIGIFARCRRKRYSYGLSRGLRRRDAGPGMYVAGHDIGGRREAAGAVGDTTPIPARAGVPGEPPMPTHSCYTRTTIHHPQRNARRSQRNVYGGSEKARNPWKLEMGPAFFRCGGDTPLGSVRIPPLVPSPVLFRWSRRRSFSFFAGPVAGAGQRSTDVAKCELCHSFAMRY